MGGAVKQILTALVSGENAPPELRTQLGANLTQIRLALADLSSCVPLCSAWCEGVGLKAMGQEPYDD